MKIQYATLNQKGFTLIELMIVVGIIGILVAIAAPNFSKYQSKARQSEAKIALSAVYGAEKSFYSEYNAYIGSMDAVGYAPEGSKRFYRVGWVAPPSGGVTGYAGATTNASWAPINNSFIGCGAPAALGTTTTLDVQTFLVVATGCIRQNSGVYDTWNITDAKVIRNNTIGL
jgi:prepilin-type N-terminal cleavage/methylation domain-containing protein